MLSSIFIETGLPYKVLSILFRLKRHHAQRIIQCQEFPCYRVCSKDFEHISHEEFSQNHTTTFVKTLFTNDNSQAVVVLDGTCIYSEKLELQVPKEII